MNTFHDYLLTSEEHIDFWESLRMDLLTSNQGFASKDFHAFLERSMMYSMFFRGCPPLELVTYHNLLGNKSNGYIIILDITDHGEHIDNKGPLDEIQLYYEIKRILCAKNNAVGPLINSRISILITEDSFPAMDIFKNECEALCHVLTEILRDKFHLNVSIGIGTIQTIKSIYNSFMEALTCLYYLSNNKLIHYLDLNQEELHSQFDYFETEKHLMKAIRLRKDEAINYFGLLIEHLRPMNDDMKRNKLLELLVLSGHSMRIDRKNDDRILNYSDYVNHFMTLKGDQLLEYAYQSFIYITSYVRQQNTIDYSNNVVQMTKEYLEKHYAEDISLENVAEQVNISPQYFSKLIKKNTGFNFIDWLSMLRVKKAKELLINSNYTVKEVCFMVGYKDPNYFSRIFKKRIGITPSEFIKTRN
jgi:two-component system response regulator YesN